MHAPASLLRDADRSLLWAAGAMAALAPVSLVLLVTDGRVLDGANVWAKPLKFQLSLAIFFATLALMVGLVAPRLRRGLWVRGAVWIAIGTGVFEIVWITLRAAMAERSHYATDTAFGTAMYVLMGIGAVLLSLTPLVVSVVLMCSRLASEPARVLRWGVCVGTFAGLVGTAWVGQQLGSNPAHYPSGAEDAASRLPVVGWSTERGDLRIAHFVGMHAMQGLFVLALLCAWRPGRWARAVLVVVGAAWVAATVLLARMAVRDESPFGLLF